MSISKYIKSHAVLVTTIALLAVVVMIIAGRMASSKKDSGTTNSGDKLVTLVDASTFRGDYSSVSADGVVESVSQVDIKSQVSAPLSQVNFSVGDYVSAGQVIAELQNADIRAQLEQARANLALAKGQYTSGDISVDSTRKAVIDKIRDAYSKADDAIHAQIGQFVYTGNSNNPQLQSYVVDQNIGNRLGEQWSAALRALQTWKDSIDKLKDSSTQEEVNTALGIAQKSLATLSTLTDTVSDALVSVTNTGGQSILSLVSTWKAITTNARATINSSIASLTGAGSSLVTNQAQISGAEAGVKNLQAQLAKTVITSPIAGKIAALPLRVGEFASPGQLITTVVGAGGLQVKAYASGEDLDRIRKDASVKILGNIEGTVVSVAPSVSQINKKVEVKVLIKNSETSGLVVGENVQVSIQAVPLATSEKSTDYVVPIQNVKIIPGDAYVYTVDENSKVVKHSVTLGNVKGDFVEIKTGLTNDMKIISPVYELEEGETVKTE